MIVPVASLLPNVGRKIDCSSEGCGAQYRARDQRCARYLRRRAEAQPEQDSEETGGQSREHDRLAHCKRRHGEEPGQTCRDQRMNDVCKECLTSNASAETHLL